MPLDLADAVRLDLARARVAKVSEALGGLPRELRGEARRRVFAAYQAVEAVGEDAGALEAALAAAEALADLPPPDEPAPFRPVVVPLAPPLLRGAVRQDLIDDVTMRHAPRVGVDRFVQAVFDRLPDDLVRAFLDKEREEGAETPREDYELIWRKPRR